MDDHCPHGFVNIHEPLRKRPARCPICYPRNDRKFLESNGWSETSVGWINRRAVPFAGPMPLSDAAKIQRIIDNWNEESYEPPKDDLNRVRVRCQNCHKEITVNADWCDANDWPECCGGVMEVVGK